MILTTLNGMILSEYYSTDQGGFGDYCFELKPNWWRLTPYNFHETLFWFSKHIALPGIATLILPIAMILRIFNNPIIVGINYILYIIAISLIASFIREVIRFYKYKIKEKNGLIDVKIPYNLNNEAALFTHPLNEISRTKFTIGFVGDIMMMKKFKLKFHQGVINFFSDVDLVVGNLEGIISKDKPPLTKQSHDYIILTRLQKMLTGCTRMLLCLTNNHSADFGNKPFNKSLHRIQNRRRFDTFGRSDISNIVIQKKNINISCATEWSNQKKWNFMSNYEDINDRIGIRPTHLANHFNILYPHWGFENEKYVRKRIQLDAKALLTGLEQKYSLYQNFTRELLAERIQPDPDKKWDLIFGHHPHVRQPIMEVEDTFINNSGVKIPYKKLVVFSGGNFTSGADIIRHKKHNRGIIMKCEIGPLKGYRDKLVAGNVEWRNTINLKSKKIKTIKGKKFRTKTVSIDRKPYRTYSLRSLIIGSVTMGIIGLIFVFNILS